MNVWLLDIDGVLVWSAGYRAALKATINHFTRLMGLGEAAPDDAVVDEFEAHGISSEWNSGPMIVAGLIYAAWLRQPNVTRSAALEATLADLQAAGLTDLQADHTALAGRVAAARRPGESPAQAALRLLLDDALAVSHAAGELPGLEKVLTGLLAETGHVPGSATTSVFQHFALGSQVFAETYDLPSAFEAASHLEQHDYAAIGPELRDRVCGMIAAGTLKAAILTARPSMPPSRERAGDGENRPSGYSPEAELAAHMVGLDDVPVIGFGHLQWLGAATQTKAQGLVKPSPVHALSALAVAGGASPREALLAAYELAMAGRLTEPLHALNSSLLSITVFEDSSGGILSGQAAARLLTEHGVPAQCRAFGIAANPAKQAALAALGAQVFEHVDQAMEVALASGG